jgi:hypothetical protein
MTPDAEVLADARGMTSSHAAFEVRLAERDWLASARTLAAPTALLIALAG